ncbi:hypothetical protein GCM10027430_27030 [Lysobacter tyrosinilyticus]
MRLSRSLVKSTPLLLAGCIGGAATVWSPISCSCVDAWEDLAAGAGLSDIQSPDQLTARAIADGLRDKFSGKAISPEGLPSTGSYDCAAMGTTSHTIHCTWWVWTAGNSMKGYEAFFHTDSQGIFKSVSVSPIQYIDAESRR